MKMTSEVHAVALALCSQIERGTLNHLIARLGGPEKVWEASETQWLSACKLNTKTVETLNRWREVNRPSALFDRLMSTGIIPLVQEDYRYPASLRQWGEDAPAVLFAKGEAELLQRLPLISVIGTRRASSYGLEAARWVVQALVEAGCTVVSGLALGIDGEAHRTAVDMGGLTVAVLGCGVDICYPVSNRDIYRRILETGLLISEYPPGAKVAKHHFLERNRIIAGLSQGVAVIQAGEKSGALTTVDAALSLGRDIYVVPGPITSKLYRGSNRLLKDGAGLLMDPREWMSELGLRARTLRNVQPARWSELYMALDTAQTPSNLSQQLQVPLNKVYVALLELELEGWVTRLPGGLYRRNRKDHHPL